ATCAVVLVAMKAVVSVGADAPRLSAARWLWFAAAWPGMRPQAFAPGCARSPSGRELVRLGLVRMAIGALLFATARAIWQRTGSAIAATALALPMPILFHPAFLRGVVWPLLGPRG